MLKFFFLFASVAVFVLTVNGQSETTPKKVARAEEKPTVVVDNDLHEPLFRAAQQILAGGRRRQGGRGGRRNRSPAQWYYKPLLRALKKEDRRELRQVVLSNITKDEIAQKVDKWIQEAEDPKAKEAFEIFKQERELMGKLKLIGEQNFLDEKSDEAKKLFAELKQVFDDRSLSWDQSCTRHNEILYKADREVMEELRRKGRPCFRNESWEKLTGSKAGGDDNDASQKVRKQRRH
ncbi:hypothetical protein M3Y97_00664800 [Aphelenchoides bicaudatus]|nr:hypothetical protein M3Y97_00664800 [Aphelenchoides bicaudatus]